MRPSFTQLVLTGIGLGVAVGLFFGEAVAGIRILGEVYIGLLQMTVLPYIAFSLIANIGRLDLERGKLLAVYGLAVLLALWVLALAAVGAMSLALPGIEGGSYFSTSLIERPPPFDFVGLFVPANPFWSLANNAVPAVVLFCLLFGTAIIGFKDKEAILTPLDLVARVLHRVNGIVIRLTPIGAFAITAAAAGTLTLQDLGRLNAYLIVFTVGILVFSLWLLPKMVSVVTPFPPGRIRSLSRDAIITAFVTGSVFVVIPLLIDGINSLLEEHPAPKASQSTLPDVVLPLAYPFPHAGKILTLFFIPFAAWFYGEALALVQYPLLAGAGVFVLFGKVVTAVPFLLTLFQIPADIFNIFLATGILTGRIADIAACMHLVAFTLLTTALVTGRFKVAWRRLLLSLGTACTITVILILGLRVGLGYGAEKARHSEEEITAARTLLQDVAYVVLDQPRPNPVPLRPGQTRLERIRERGAIRVGFMSDTLPFVFHNSAGELVGFDIDLVFHLARDLGVSVEFVPADKHDGVSQLDDDYFDIAISGVTATVAGSKTILFSDPYLTSHLALVVPDYRKSKLDSERDIGSGEGLRAAVLEGSYFAARSRIWFPELELVKINDERDFFEAPEETYDLLVTSAEGGSAWTLLYPGFSTVNPLDPADQAPIVIAIAGFDFSLEEYLELWISIKRLDGTIDRIFDRWILGQTEEARNPRWSVIRDVLHWVE